MTAEHPSPNRRGFLRTLGIGAGLFAGGEAPGQSIEGLLKKGGRWISNRIDPGVLNALPVGDLARPEAWLGQLAGMLAGEQVLELGRLEDAASAALPVLESRPETRGYAAWLRSRLDYFQVAGDFLERLAPPAAPPGQLVPPPPNPTPNQERQAWQRQVATQPAPRGAGTWVPRLKPVFLRARAPAELVWLAEIESGFEPGARSPAGAAGMFQLMPRTAEGLGLRLQPRDERLDPEKSARAAATYLRQLHRQFRDWPLAVAAYNAGPGRVSEVLKRRRAASFDSAAPGLPAETQMYVPKFEAVLQRRERKALVALKLPA